MNYRHSCEAMGTRFEVILGGDNQEHLEAVAVAICEEILRLDATLSHFNPGSEIARINREAKNKSVRIDREIFALLEICEQARQNTNGFFDVTAATGGAGIELDAERCSVRFLSEKAQIDLGAIGKGYALDCGFEILSRFGVESALLNGGTSSMLAVGDSFTIDLRHPLEPKTIVHRVALQNRALSCSAVRHPGQSESDVVNPLIGASLNGEAACVVLTANATEAEIFSTALLAMGKDDAKLYFERRKCAEMEAGWIIDDELLFFHI